VTLRIRELMIAVLAVNAAACGGETGPAAPSIPQLTAEWRQSGSSASFRFLDNVIPGAVVSYGCSQGGLSLRQAGRALWGSGALSGFGPSEPYCTHEFSFTAIVASDGAVTDARLGPPFPARGCTFVSGDGVFSGTATGTALRIQMTDQWICPSAIGNMIPMERTLRLSFRRF
jgi:hypothetical protein